MCSARVNLSCWQDICVTSESTGWQVKMICGEMFVFCSGLLVSLAFGVSCQRSRPSEIRWLNVKQPTSARLGLDHDQARSRSRSKLIMSESFAFCSSLSVSLAFETRHERVELALARSGPDSTTIRTRDSVRLSSRGELNLISNGSSRGSGSTPDSAHLGVVSAR